MFVRPRVALRTSPLTLRPQIASAFAGPRHQGIRQVRQRTEPASESRHASRSASMVLQMKHEHMLPRNRPTGNRCHDPMFTGWDANAGSMNGTCAEGLSRNTGQHLTQKSGPLNKDEKKIEEKKRRRRGGGKKEKKRKRKKDRKKKKKERKKRKKNRPIETRKKEGEKEKKKAL